MTNINDYPFWYIPFGHIDLKYVQKNAIRTKTLCLVQSIVVDKYGGTVEVDSLSGTFAIDVPEEYKVQCSQEISDLLAML